MYVFVDATEVNQVPLRSGIIIEDVERGAELSFSGPLRGPPSRPLRGPCIIVKFCLHQILVSDRRTDGLTDRHNKHILGLPS